MPEYWIKIVKGGAWFLIAIAAVMASYQYKVSVESTYPTRTFSVDGSGDVDSTPDLAMFSVTVMTDGGKNIADVQNANAEKMNNVNAFLKEQGIDKADLKTTQYSLNPRYSSNMCTTGNCPAPTIIGYSLTQTLDVKVRDNAKLGDLLSGVVASGANNVSEVRFVLDDDSSAKEEAREKAIVEAKKKAKALAKSAGFRMGKLVSLYENSTPIAYGMGGDVMAASEKSSVAPSVEPGTQSTKVQVTLTYEIKN